MNKKALPVFFPLFRLKNIFPSSGLVFTYSSGGWVGLGEGGGGGDELGGLKSESLRPRSKTDGGDGPPDTPTEKSYYAGV